MNRRICQLVICGIVLLTIFGFCSTGVANDEGWQFELIPAYVWIPGFSGNLGLEGEETPGDSPPGESLVNFDFGYLLHAEVRKGRFGAFADGLYVKLVKNAKAGLPNLDVEFQAGISDFAGIYQVYEHPLGAEEDQRFWIVDLLAGGRYMAVDLEIDLFDKLLTLGGNEQWIDPIIGARTLVDLGRKFTGTLRGDVGGFGVNADLTWSLSGTLSYHFNKTFSLWGGYRALGVQYEIGSGSDRFLFDMTMHGPLVGFGLSF